MRSRLVVALALVLLPAPAHGQLLERLFGPWQQQPQACYGPGCGTPQAYGQVTYGQPMLASQASSPPRTFAQPASFSSTNPSQWTSPNRPSEPLPAEIAAAVVQIRGFDGTGANVGSGVLVDKDEQTGLIVTCAHITRGASAYQVSFPSGQQFMGRVVAIDQQRDVACIEIAAPQSALPIELSEADPQPGETVRSYGYGGDSRLAGNEGRVLGYVSPQGTADQPWFEVSGNTRSGDSGGPIFTTSYRLAGVSHGCGPTCVDGCRVGILRRVIGRRIRARQFARARAQQRATAPPAVSRPPAGSTQPASGSSAPPAPQQPPSLEPTPPLVPVQPAQPDELAGWKGRVAELEQTLAQVRASLDDAVKVRDLTIKQREELTAERDRLRVELAAARQQLATAAAELAAKPKVEAEPGPQIDIAPPPGPIARKVEGVAAKAGGAWLTKLLVGVGLPAGPAGVAAGLLASAAIAYGGYKLRGMIGERRLARWRKTRSTIAAPSEPDRAARSHVVERTHLQVAQVPTTNRDHEYLLEALRRETNEEPKLGPYVERIMTTFQQLRGKSVNDAVSRKDMPSGAVLGWADKQPPQ